MNKKKIPSRTSLMADEKTHEYVKRHAREIGISQTKCLAMIIDEKIHRDKLAARRKAEAADNLDIQTALNQINRRLEKIEKRENPRDTIVSFFRTQEREILLPMKIATEKNAARIDEVIQAIKDIK